MYFLNDSFGHPDFTHVTKPNVRYHNIIYTHFTIHHFQRALERFYVRHLVDYLKKLLFINRLYKLVDFLFLLFQNHHILFIYLLVHLPLLKVKIPARV